MTENRNNNRALRKNRANAITSQPGATAPATTTIEHSHDDNASPLDTHAAKTRAGMRRRAEARRRYSRHPALGTRLSVDGSTVVPDDREAKVIRSILAMRAAGLSYREIARRLNASGIPARARAWYPATVRRACLARGSL